MDVMCHSERRISARRRGFTMIEVAVATAIVGVGVTAMMMAFGSGTKVNAASQRMVTAAFIGQEARELSVRASFDALASATNTPPHDAQGVDIPDTTGWTQTITVSWVDPANVSAANVVGPTDLKRVTVTVSYGGQTLFTASWMVRRTS